MIAGAVRGGSRISETAAFLGWFTENGVIHKKYPVGSDFVVTGELPELLKLNGRAQVLYSSVHSGVQNECMLLRWYYLGVPNEYLFIVTMYLVLNFA